MRASYHAKIGGCKDTAIACPGGRSLDSKFNVQCESKQSCEVDLSTEPSPIAETCQQSNELDTYLEINYSCECEGKYILYYTK